MTKAESLQFDVVIVGCGVAGLSAAPLSSISVSLSARARALRAVPNRGATTRKLKAYSWMIDYQIAALMPNALPASSSAVQTRSPYPAGVATS